VLHARVRARAVDGRANQALIALLADMLGLPPSHLWVLRGQSARSKLIGVDGLTQADVERRLQCPGQ
jgi:uncharacterized protein YggU (UPF0235/DUF167 family)